MAPLVSQRIHVHRIPSRVRDVRDRPSSIEAGWRETIALIFVSVKTKYFVAVD
jgi:hypothetical protein